MSPIPPMRYVDVTPVEVDGRQLVCISDPRGYVDTQLVLSPPAFVVAACLDGTRDVTAVRKEFSRQFGGMSIAEAQVVEIVETLDAHGFLLSPRFETMRTELEKAFRAARTRPAYIAGRGYSAEPGELRTYIDGFFTREGGPGAGLGAPGDGAPPQPCLIVPHIDFHRGGASYAHGYRRLYGAGKPDLVFIFGVAHAGAPAPFVLTRKHFETPFGTLETDQAVMDELEAACSWDPYAYELVHRTEHSIEFQAVMLAYLYGTDVKIVPILCAQFSADCSERRPAALPAVQRFLDACRAIAERPERRVSVIAGADLAHVGRRFGDDFEIDDDILAAVARRDEEDLAHVLRGAPDDFYASVMRDENERRVCGLGCIYAALKTVDGAADHAALLHYDYAPDPAGGIVSFASVAVG